LLHFYVIAPDMDVLLFLFCGLATVVGNFRVGGFNSRLGRFELPFTVLREFARTRLIWAAVFAPKRHFRAQSRKFPLQRELREFRPRHNRHRLW
jgi:hypothetical protein